MRTLITAPKSPRHRRWKQGLNYLKAVILQASGRLPIEVNNEEKIISEQSELCSDMVAEMKRFELLRRGTPDLPHFECGPFNHLGTSPYISVCFILEKFLERKAGENTEKYSIFDFENPFISRISGGRNDQAAVKFRVSPVMTASIRFHIRLKHGKTRFVHTILSVLREKVKRFLAKRLTYTGQSGYNNCVL